MARRYHDTGFASKITYRKGEHGRWHQRRGQIDLNTICREYFCRLFCKQVGFDARIIGDCRRGVFIFLFHKFCQSLCRTADCIDVHPVCTCANDSTQSPGAKFQRTIKPVKNTLIVLFNFFNFTVQIFVFQMTCFPLQIEFSFFHCHTTFSYELESPVITGIIQYLSQFV